MVTVASTILGLMEQFGSPKAGSHLGFSGLSHPQTQTWDFALKEF